MQKNLFIFIVFGNGRMARMEAAVFMGLLTGSLTSNYIFEVTSTQFMFVLATILIAIALIYIKFAVSESVIGATENDERLWVRKIGQNTPRNYHTNTKIFFMTDQILRHIRIPACV